MLDKVIEFLKDPANIAFVAACVVAVLLIVIVCIATSASRAAKKKKAKAAAAVQKEAQEASLEADLINLGADPESAKSFMAARSLGLDTKKFGMIRRNGKFVGSYSSIAEKLSKDSLTDSLSSRVINEKGFTERVVALGGTRRGRVDALVRASKGGQK